MKEKASKIVSKSVQENEEKYQTIFESNRDSITIFRLNPDHTPSNFIDVNPATIKLLGYTREELLTMSVRDIETLSDEERQTRVETLLAQGKIIFTTKIKNKIGENRQVEVETFLISHENQPAFMNITRDITERKQMEKNIGKAYEKLATIFEAIPDLMFEVGMNGKIYHYHSHRTDLLAMPPEAFVGKFFQDVLPENIVTICNEAIQEATLKGWSIGKQYSLDFAQGKKWFELSVSPLKTNSHHDNRFILLARDITDRKQAIVKLQENEEKLQVIYDSVSEAIYLLDENAIFLDVNKGAEKMYQYAREELIGKTPYDFAAPGLNDFEALNKKMELLTETNPVQFEFWAVRKNGEIFSKEVVVNKSKYFGKDVFISTARDISDRKKSDYNLKESEKKYRSLIEDSPNGIVIYIESKIVFINDEGIRMLQAKNKEEIINKSVFQFVHPESFESVNRRMQEVIINDKASDIVEELFIDLNGTPFDVELKAIPILYQNLNAVQVIVNDITKRKRATIELNKINRVYSLISQINNLIIRSKNRAELFQEICNITISSGKFKFSWIGLLNTDNTAISTVAYSGIDEIIFSEYQTDSIVINDGGEKGQTQTAILEKRTVISNNIATDPLLKKWRKQALRVGCNSSISIPITLRNKIIGTFNLYAGETNFFSSEEEIDLLEKITQNIAFALETIQIEEERKFSEEKIKQLSQAVEQSPVTIIITNTFGEIEYVNPKFSETTGYSFEEIIGKNPRILKSNHTSPHEFELLWKTLLSGNEWHGEFHNVRKNGELYWESSSISPILNTEGKTTHYIAINEDITERKKVEKQLINAKEKAEESDRLKLAFLANMSHEIRTPMNGILGFTELLKQPRLNNDEQQEYITIIEKSGIRMLNIINDIISISKVESGQIEVSLSETNINEQIEYLYHFFKPEASQKGIKLYTNTLLETKEAILHTDKEKLYAILTNLVKNAIKFTDSGSIEFGYRKKEKCLEFFVKDSGLGISESQQKIIFERFRQANDTISRSHEGSGLGLAISKAYVETLGGKIWVTSEERKGSTFYFTIPLDRNSKIKGIANPEKVVVKEKNTNLINNLKVLVVEDDAISQLLITIALKPFAKEILKVCTGIDAIEICKNNPDIDLVMMDINMPEMGGHEATREIRKFNKNLIIIAQTANGMQSDRDDAIAAGCTDYISKPVNMTILTELIEKYFI